MGRRTMPDRIEIFFMPCLVKHLPGLARQSKETLGGGGDRASRFPY